MKKFTSIFASLALILLMSSFVKTDSGLSWLDGDWKGLKYQTNADKAWITEILIDSQNGQYVVAYEELGCIGTLELISAGENRAIFIEKLEEGSCMSDGYIIITKVDEKHISFTCLRDNQQRLASFSTLERQVVEMP